MKARTVEIPGAADTGGPFIVGETLTIYEAAMVYSGRHPGGRYIEGESLEAHESFLGRGVLLRRGFDERPYKTSWAVYRELCERADRREIKPVRTYFLNDKLDPRLTVIRTVDLANLAEERGDSSFDFSSWMPASTPDVLEHRSNRARRKPKRDQARALIQALYPGGPPSKEDVTVGELMHQCGQGHPEKIDRRTFGRAWYDLLAEADRR